MKAYFKVTYVGSGDKIALIVPALGPLDEAIRLPRILSVHR